MKHLSWCQMPFPGWSAVHWTVWWGSATAFSNQFTTGASLSTCSLSQMLQTSSVSVSEHCCSVEILIDGLFLTFHIWAYVRKHFGVGCAIIGNYWLIFGDLSGVTVTMPKVIIFQKQHVWSVFLRKNKKVWSVCSCWGLGTCTPCTLRQADEVTVPMSLTAVQV